VDLGTSACDCSNAQPRLGRGENLLMRP